MKIKRISWALAVLLPNTAVAQHEHHTAAPDTAAHVQHDMSRVMDGPIGVSHVRMGSGTTWMPDNSVMHANHKMWGDWTVMIHGVAFGQYDHQGSKRGDSQLGVVDWEMLMAMRSIGSGRLHLHGMVSLEPLTLGGRGYPLLLQSGESYKDEPLHDRQHPHDAFMEIAALFQQPIARNLALELYGGIAGEPALGPVAFMHRPSAQSDPLAPLGHHWQDATHISFGVLTAGLYSRSWKIEGSTFNGREPDENRWDLDLRKLDSYSGRVTVNPARAWSLSSWYGYLASPEAHHPEESVRRYGASALHDGRGIAGGAWSSTLMLAANNHGGHRQSSVLGETNLEIGSRNTIFGRAELVQKSAGDLVLDGIDPERVFDVKSFVAGYLREVKQIRGGTIGLGARASINFIQKELGQFYGTTTPKGINLYVRIRPKAMEQSMGAAPPAAKPSGAPMTMPMNPPVTHNMQEMRHDTAAKHHDSSATHHDMPGIKHDSTHHMPAAADKSAAPKTSAARATTTAKRKTAAKKPVAAKKKPATAKKPATKKPAAKDPHAGHDMKGMTMKPDTSKRKK